TRGTRPGTMILALAFAAFVGSGTLGADSPGTDSKSAPKSISMTATTVDGRLTKIPRTDRSVGGKAAVPVRRTGDRTGGRAAPVSARGSSTPPPPPTPAAGTSPPPPRPQVSHSTSNRPAIPTENGPPPAPIAKALVKPAVPPDPKPAIEATRIRVRT